MINIPQKPQQNKSGLFTLAGMGIGGALGGAPGMAVGGQVGGLAGQQKQMPSPEGVPVSNALTRRQADLGQSPQMQIRESIDSLKYIEDPAQRVEMAKPLLQAEYLMKQKGAYG